MNLIRGLALLFAVLAPAQDAGLAPWGSNRQPTDATKRHVEETASGRHAYTVLHGGTMDGTNCRSPQGVWTPFEQTWESNRSVRMENVGETDVVNPWLSNGRNDFRSIDEIVARAVAPGMTPGEKAMALWWQQAQHRFHYQGDNDELMEPTKIFNVYGHNTCGNDSIGLAGLWKKAGLKVAPARLVGHCVSQAFYDGRWHLLDGDMQSVYLLRDNETVAGEQDLVRDHDLIRRTHTQGILHPDGRAGDEWESSIYVFEGEVNGDRNCRGDATMNMTLRPGEALTWRWGRLNPAKVHGAAPKYPDRICNGLWEYRPDFTKETWRKGAAVEGVRATDRGLAAEEGKAGVIAWTMRSPYVFVGGRLEVDGRDAKFAVSWDGKTWEKIGEEFDSHFPPGGPARYAYHLKCELSGEARLKRLAIINDLQMAPLALPGLVVGRNALAYTDASTGARRVRLTHEWVERSASRPPGAPAAPEHPSNDADAEGTDIVFTWKPSADADGDRVVDYHFELSARADMKWPLSMSFAKLISRTADAGKAQYTLPGAGLLSPDRRYFWRVRAKDDKGVWGPWSETWSFTPRGPAPPVDLAFEHDPVSGAGVLRWKPNPAGRKPVRYRIYASDEKGFSASDEPYKVTVGVTKDLPSPFPANFVAETEATESAAVGKAFYRVVAVDARGKRSGPSDYVAARRPVITSAPVTEARVGAAYRYALSTVRSLGDLRTRIVNGRETMGFWDIEKARFAIQRGPSWLKIDEASGVLSGTPDAAGKVEVEVEVTLERELRKLDEAALKWGNEKVVASGTEKVGSAGQRFVIDVRPQP
jgi:hypothetical protein